MSAIAAPQSLRVVHVVVAGNVGGAERMLVDLASRPDATRAEHALALFSPTPEVGALFRERGVRVHDRGRVKEGPIRYLRQVFGRRDVAFVADVLEKERADVAHLHVFASHVVGTRAALRAGVRILRTDHSARAYQDPSCVPFSMWAIRHAGMVVGVSDHLRQLSLRRAPFCRADRRVVLNGVDTTRFRLAPIERAERAPFDFVLVGRLEPRKGIDIALDALREVPNARLEIVGDGPERRRLERHARDSGVASRVTFHGFLGDVQAVVRRAHAGLSSSRAEGLGLGLLEIMATGRPVVAVPVGGMPEIVKDGSTGLLAARADASALAVAMRALADLPAPALAHLGASSRRFVEEKASVDAMCAGYADAYEALMATPSPRAAAAST